ncbi:putative ribosomally synthesized peptide with SipW-like signal peptide [Nesterenkonia halotolerans]|uniref:Ribosomally synthesized peptide with SipW-like signal peptide n=1 Tax=Nesterenkonia halotolerans TaxID=225325 RepID=A0ABR9J779_9MICC|nr:putative ribosomally synthesized peptide with SipW-like signal peptide [Nesterenkonia halotolerans]
MLGIGAAVTLAAWNDSEFAEGIFTAGNFNLVGSTEDDPSSFTDHNVNEADEVAALTFDAGNIVPGETVYAPFHVRLDEDTTVDGSIEAAEGVELAAEGENTEFLAYSLHRTSDCSSGGVSESTPIAESGSLAPGPVPLAEAIPLESNGDDVAGETISFCFVVSADDSDLVESASATATWEFLAVSDDA